MYLGKNVYSNIASSSSENVKKVNLVSEERQVKSPIWDNYEGLKEDEGLKIKKGIIIITTSGKKIEIDKLIKNSSKLVFRYSFSSFLLVAEKLMT